MRRGLLILFVALPLFAGAAPVRAASSPYLLPFPAGTSVYVSEGNSEGDHEAIDGEQYAFDFVVAGVQMATGTPVVAARAGTVIGAQSGSSGPAEPRHAQVDHGDGTSALYEFVNPKVRVGDRIAQGELVGGVMQSGFSVAPHVLFQVETTPTSSKTPGWWHTSSVPVSFADPDVVAKVSEGIPTRERGPYASSVAESIPSALPINEVPLDSSGVLKTVFYQDGPPYYFLAGQLGTVTAESMDETTGILWLAVTVPGNRITRQDCFLAGDGSHTVTLCSFKGATVWLTVKDRTIIMYPNGERLGYGPQALMQYTAVGKQVNFAISIGFIKGLAGEIPTPAEGKANQVSFNELQSSVGMSFPRDKKEFVFFPGWVQAYP
jgi:hypothetical protein